MVCPLSCLMTYCCYGHEGLISRLSSQLLRCRLHSWEKTAVWSVAFVPLIREIIQYWIISQLVNTESVHLTNKADPFGLLISWNLIISIVTKQSNHAVLHGQHLHCQKCSRCVSLWGSSFCYCTFSPIHTHTDHTQTPKHINSHRFTILFHTGYSINRLVDRKEISLISH